MGNFNYLIEDRRMRKLCRREIQNECYWVPLRVRATVGDKVNISMYCRRCECREDIFVTEREYKSQENLIITEVERA